jgi:ribonucleotide reductase alpha subunit
MANTDQMFVTKRNGERVEVAFDKILNRAKNLCANIEPPIKINYAQLVMKVIDQLYSDIPTTTIDELLAEQCASLSTKKLEYGVLASRIVVSNHHKNTPGTFLDAMDELFNFKDSTGKSSPLISEHLWAAATLHSAAIEDAIDYDRDFLIDYFGFKTLERAYMMRVGGKIVERPQHMWMRTALGIHLGSPSFSIAETIKTYELMSMKYFTHATPTLFNAGTPRPQLSSCYLVAMEDDSIDGIFNTLKETAQISKWAGGIGLHIHNVRATGTHIRGTNGSSNGIVPMLRVYNMTARYVDQGGGKRNGSFAIYLEPYHADICDFLDLKKNHGDEEMRARDLFYGLWIPDKFMNAVNDDKEWHLFCPDLTKGLSDVHGEEFNKLYDKYVSENKHVKTMRARDLWFKILDSQMETGTPYLLYKDAANAKSNQQNLGTIKSSNLCTEIIEYSDKDQTAVCNLASIGLSTFIVEAQDGTKSFDFEKLHEVTKVVTINLDKVIDVNYYPTEKTRTSNLLHRPIGIGVQGLSDAFAMLDIAFDSNEASALNKDIFETIYHAALEQSMEISRSRRTDMEKISAHDQIQPVMACEYNHLCTKREYSDNGMVIDEVYRCRPIVAEIQSAQSGGHPGAYSSFMDSPAAMGKLQFDLWGVSPSDRYDWTYLKQQIMRDGIRNSLLVAPMPTASTSQILGNNECFEPFTSNIYSRRTIAGEFVVVNKHLMAELSGLGLWSEAVKDSIIANKGSIQHIEGLSDHIKNKYKTVWEIPMKRLIDMAADRGAFICQSQSLNLWMEDPNYKSLTSMHFYSWKRGLKTGIYYLRRKPRHQPQQFTIDPSTPAQQDDDDEPCEMCSA